MSTKDTNPVHNPTILYLLNRSDDDYLKPLSPALSRKRERGLFSSLPLVGERPGERVVTLQRCL
ncbi:MAG: hypothetical protein ABIO64_18050, partial [Burkholderiaceae bacterium]